MILFIFIFLMLSVSACSPQATEEENLVAQGFVNAAKTCAHELKSAREKPIIRNEHKDFDQPLGDRQGFYERVEANIEAKYPAKSRFAKKLAGHCNETELANLKNHYQSLEENCRKLGGGVLPTVSTKNRLGAGLVEKELQIAENVTVSSDCAKFMKDAERITASTDISYELTELR